MKYLIALLCILWVSQLTAKTNCHGFAWQGDGWIAPRSGVATDNPEPGDIVVYSFGGEIKHSAVYVGGGWVASKLGSLPVVAHPIGWAPFVYGDRYRVISRCGGS